MSKYADVYLCPMPEENIAAYKKVAAAAGKAHRNTAMKKIMADPDMMGIMPKGEKPPFDYKRMVYGGFKVLVDL